MPENAKKKKQKSNHKLLAVLDFETDPFEYNVTPEPFCAGVYYVDTKGREVYKEFWDDDPRKLCSNIAHYLHDKNLRCYAHNGGRFDFYFLIEYLEEELLVIGNRIAEATLGQCTLVDSYLLLPLPLSAYQKDTIDYRCMTRDQRDKNKAKILRYLHGDCIYLFNWLSEWRERFGLTLTLATAAFKELKKTDYKIQQHRNESYDEKFREFYFGGRTQCFESGIFSGNYKYVDINSAYPFAMLQNHPNGYDLHYLDYVPDGADMYFAHVDATSHGALPYRDEKGGLSFPVGRYDFFATSWEINAGLITGTLKIHKIHKCYLPLQLDNFYSFVKKWYKEKSDAKKVGDKTREQFAKLILNSCYGKFALNPNKFKKYALVESGTYPAEGEPDEWEIIFDNFEYSIYQKPDPGNSYYNILTAASITGYVRAYLWLHIAKSKNVLYCDTDSLVCQDFKGNFGNKLGQWKLEANIINAHIGGKKLYCFETDKGEFKTASKGARLSPEQIRRIVNGEIINWQNEAPTFSLKGVRFINRNIKATI